LLPKVFAPTVLHSPHLPFPTLLVLNVFESMNPATSSRQ